MSIIAEDPVAALQQAIYDVLTGDAALMAQVTGVFDHIPEDQDYPYLVVGEVTETPDNRHRGFGRSVVEHLHIWSQARGFAEALAIKARVVALLDHQPLTVSGVHVVAVRFDFSQNLTDPEPPGDIRHIPLDFRVDTEQPTETS